MVAQKNGIHTGECGTTTEGSINNGTVAVATQHQVWQLVVWLWLQQLCAAVDGVYTSLLRRLGVNVALASFLQFHKARCVTQAHVRAMFSLYLLLMLCVFVFPSSVFSG